jgi:hypothetical protein
VNCLSCERETAYEYLCQPCASQLDRHLRELPPLYDALGAYLRPSSQVSTSVGGGCPSPDAPLPLDEPALDLRGPGGIVTVLETWRQALYEDAEMRWPEPFGDYPGRLLRAVRALREQLPYIAGSWPQASQFASEVRELHGAARSIIAPAEKTVRAGLCPAELGDGTVCGAVLRAVPGDPEIRCRWCQATYGPSTWLKLADAA